MFEPRDSEFSERVRQIFHTAPFVRYLGMELTHAAPGEIHTRLHVKPEFLQQDKVIHAGILVTMADHSAGGAAATLCAADQIVLTADIHQHLLRAATGGLLVCRSKVLKPGARFSVVESEVFSQQDREEILVSKGSFTIAIVTRQPSDAKG